MHHLDLRERSRGCTIINGVVFMQYNPVYDRATPGLWRSPNGAFIPLRALIMRSLMLRLLPLSFLTTACSPLASSPFDAKYQLELTLHVVQTNLDDLRHDISCFQTELQILDSRMKQSEAVTQTLKVQDLQQLVAHVRSLDQKLARVEKIKENHCCRRINLLYFLIYY